MQPTAGHRVNAIPANELGVGTVPVPVTSDAGLAPVDDGALFYWFFESARAHRVPEASTIPLVVWLNGGPGSSSLLGLFSENGPFRLTGVPGTVTTGPAPWNRSAHLLYWDQPVGTGFSPVVGDRYARTERAAAEAFASAMATFYDRHGYRNCPLYIAGESYAGKFIPHIASVLLERHPEVPLRGISIGDGWVSPAIQARAQVAFAFELGFIDTRERLAVEHELDRADREFTDGDPALAYRIQNDVEQRMLACAGQPDIFDVRRWSDAADADTLTRYLNQPAFLSSVGLETDATWAPATDDSPVARALESDGMRDALPLLARLVDQIEVLVYTGNFDMSCGYAGAERMLAAMDWSGSDRWSQVDRLIWTDADGTTLGYVKQLEHLTQVVVPGAGHLAPADQPVVTRRMIEQWMAHEPFVGTYPPPHVRVE